jgi:signal recognition particle receptor subunit beta
MSKPTAPPAPPPPEWLLLGVERSGKTCLSRCLRAAAGEERGVSLATEPTNGVERDEIVRPNVGNDSAGTASVMLTEIGGSMRASWSSYFKNIAGILFVLDVADPSSLSQALFELASLLANPSLGNSAFALLLHKQDLPGALSRAQLQQSLRLDDLIRNSKRKVTIVETSAAKEIGIEQTLQILRGDA